MKTMATWFTAAVMVAAVVQGCSVTVNDPDGGIGGSGGSGGSTGGTGGTGGAAGSAAGTGGTSGAAGTGGGTSDAGPDGDGGSGVACSSNPNDPACTKCGYTKCMTDYCACNGVTSCRSPMLAFLDCASKTGADFEACATTFIVNSNPDSSGGGLANDLATCMLDECIDTCEGREASARTAEEKARLRALFSRH